MTNVNDFVHGRRRQQQHRRRGYSNRQFSDIRDGELKRKIDSHTFEH